MFLLWTIGPHSLSKKLKTITHNTLRIMAATPITTTTTTPTATPTTASWVAPTGAPTACIADLWDTAMIAAATTICICVLWMCLRSIICWYCCGRDEDAPYELKNENELPETPQANYVQHL